MPETPSAPSTKKRSEPLVPDRFRSGCRVRPYEPADEDRVVALWNRALWADPLAATEWRTRYLADPNFRRETCQVALHGDRVVGFLLGFLDQSATSGNDTAWVVAFGVDEDVRRVGVGAALWEAFETEARSRGCASIVVGPYVPTYIAPGIDVAAYGGALAFCDAAGAVEVARPLSMKASLTARRFGSATDADERTRTGTISVRAAGPHDVLPCLELVRRTFPEWTGDVAGVIREQGGPLHRQVSLHVAMEDDRCIGFAMSRGERFGPFGVEPAARGGGIGGRLLESTLATIRTQGFHAAWFLWTSDQAARLYERHGFREVRRFSLRRKDVRA